VAGAISRLAREIADRGRADAAAPDLAVAAQSLLATFGDEDDVVEVASLFRDADADPIVRRGEPPLAERASDGAIELVALADRLRQAADQLASSRSETGRHLFLFSLLLELRPLSREARTERPFLEPLLLAALRAITSGVAGRAPADFSAALREAADSLARAAESRNAVFVRDDLSPIVERIERLAGPPRHRPPAAPQREPLAPEAPEEPIVPIEALAPDQPLEPSAFERSFSILHRLERAAPAVPAPAPAPSAPTPAALEVESPLTGLPVEADVVPIDSLLYQGRRALERADRVRLVLSDALRAQRPFQEIEPLVSELIDLVPLALAE
jgi:hypothetical protein